MLINSLPYELLFCHCLSKFYWIFFSVTIVLVSLGLQCMHLQIGDQFAFSIFSHHHPGFLFPLGFCISWKNNWNYSCAILFMLPAELFCLCPPLPDVHQELKSFLCVFLSYLRVNTACSYTEWISNSIHSSLSSFLFPHAVNARSFVCIVLCLPFIWYRPPWQESDVSASELDI